MTLPSRANCGTSASRWCTFLSITIRMVKSCVICGIKFCCKPPRAREREHVSARDVPGGSAHWASSCSRPDVSFPVVHVALRLELMAAGLWGVPDVAVEARADDHVDTSEVADALVVANGQGLAEPAQPRDDRLLATPAQRMHDKRLSSIDALQNPRLRLRLLRSVYFVLQLWDQSLVPKSTAYGATPLADTQRAAIGDLCVSYASESRRMQCPNEEVRASAEDIAAAFDTFGRRLLS